LDEARKLPADIAARASAFISAVTIGQYSEARLVYIAVNHEPEDRSVCAAGGPGVPGTDFRRRRILFEIAAGVLVIVGWRTRWVAAVLAIYCLLTAAIFHANLSSQFENIMLLKNIAMTGGFLLLAYAGAGRLSIDGRLTSA
jgi:uncharacterized membrane protein YphA (DoxX/SURF4 family)